MTGDICIRPVARWGDTDIIRLSLCADKAFGGCCDDTNGLRKWEILGGHYNLVAEEDIDGLELVYRISIAKALDMPQSCA